jgi:hypothetical protein
LDNCRSRVRHAILPLLSGVFESKQPEV